MAKVVIGLCDDQENIIEILREHIVSIMQEISKDEWTILEFVSPSKLLVEAKKIDILFLDIEMPEMDGIEVGRKVMSLNPKCKLLMATSRIDRFKEAFYIEATRFITKPFFRDEIKEALLATLEKKPGENEIEVFRDRVNFKIKENDISMVRAFNGYVEIIAGNGVFRKDISLNALEKQLDKRIFFRINRQFLINLRYVDSYKRNCVQVGDKKFTIAVRRQRDFINKFTEYDLNYR